MAKILITGASGLLGTEFCKQLKDAGHEVWAVDNHSRSTTIPPCDHWVKMDLLNDGAFTGYVELQQILIISITTVLLTALLIFIKCPTRY
jgi:nucleoside-diphosphate-sugar epimerase